MQINIEQGKEKLVIDYVMTNTEYLNSTKDMIIDKTKEYATYRLRTNRIRTSRRHTLITI